MMIRGKGRLALILTLTLAWGLQAAAQESDSNASRPSTSAQAAARAGAQTESSVSAELVKGRLSPAKSKPGDEVAVRLNEDLKSNGEVVLKKGATVRGVVRKVQRVDNKASAKGSGSAQSMMELQWFAPGLSGAASQQLNVALQSVVYTNPLYAHQQESNESFLNAPRSAAPARSGASGGLVGGVGAAVGGTVSSASTVGADVVGTPAATSAGVLTQTQSSAGVAAALPASAQTASALQSSFGVSGQLFHVGSGQAISSTGSVASMDIYSHMSNDTVITSSSRDFEISSGAQMQLLIQRKN